MRLVVLILFSALCGCQYDPHADLLTTVEPSPQDVVGTYIVDRLDLPSELAGKSAEIVVELRAEGDFSATNVPSRQLDLPKAGSFDSLPSGTGQWKIDRMGQLDPGAHPIYGVYLRNAPKRTAPGEDSPETSMSSALFTGQKPPYGFIFQLGDPDHGYAILLKRKP